MNFGSRGRCLVIDQRLTEKHQNQDETWVLRNGLDCWWDNQCHSMWLARSQQRYVDEIETGWL